MRLREPWPTARSKQRRREFAAAFDQVPPGSLGDMLEIGSGDGFMASLLAPLGRSLITTEPSAGRAAHAIELPRVRGSATALPFPDAAFDFIFSSSVLEHVRDRSQAFAELRRCLRPHGVMVHLMPSTTWKMLQLLLYYPDVMVSGLEMIGAERQLPAPAAATPATNTELWRDAGHEAKKTSWWRELKRGMFPQVHGEYRGHVRELLGFRARTWAQHFEQGGFEVHAQLRLPLYSGYGFGFERMRRFGEWCGLSGHTAFIATHRGAQPDAVSYWRTEPQASLAA